MQSDLADLQARLTESEANTRDLETKLQSPIDADLPSRYNDLEGRLSAAQSDAEEAQRQIIEFRDQLQAANSKREALAANKEALEGA